MKRIRKPKGISNSPLNMIPYLPDEECFFDSRHWTWGGINEELPFAVTTRISANNQQFLKVYESLEDKKNNIHPTNKGRLCSGCDNER